MLDVTDAPRPWIDCTQEGQLTEVEGLVAAIAIVRDAEALAVCTGSKHANAWHALTTLLDRLPPEVAKLRRLLCGERSEEVDA